MQRSIARPSRRAGLSIAAAVLVLSAAVGLAPNASATDGGDLASNQVLALNSSNELVTFNARRPERARSRTAVTNLKAGERLVGIDFRPLTGRLYGVGSTSQVYVIDADSGFASPIGAPFTPALAGTEFGVDFNPQADRLRVVSNAGQNLRINPDTGGATTDRGLAFAATDANAGKTPSIVGAAYTNNVARAPSTVLNDIDSGLDILATQAPPNDGTLNTRWQARRRYGRPGRLRHQHDEGTRRGARRTSGCERRLEPVHDQPHERQSRLAGRALARRDGARHRHSRRRTRPAAGVCANAIECAARLQSVQRGPHSHAGQRYWTAGWREPRWHRLPTRDRPPVWRRQHQPRVHDRPCDGRRGCHRRRAVHARARRHRVRRRLQSPGRSPAHRQQHRPEPAPQP